MTTATAPFHHRDDTPTPNELAEGMAEFCAREAIRDLIALVGAYRARCVIAEALAETSGARHAC